MPKYRYNAAWGARNLAYTWKNGTPTLDSDCVMKSVVINEKGLHIILDEITVTGYKVYLSKEECVKENLNGLVVNDLLDEDETESFHIEIPRTRTETHTIRIVEF